MSKVDLSRSLRSLVDGAMDRARRMQAVQNWKAAADAWEQAANHALEFAKHSGSEQEKQHRLASARDFQDHAARLRKMSANGPVLPTKAGRANSQAEPRSVHSAEKCAEEPNEYQQAVASLIHKSLVRFDDIAGLEETKRAIQTAYVLGLATPPAGVTFPPVRNILFYGPPGCGKTLLAGAASNGLDATFFSAKVSDLMSKYFGESSKLVTALYDEARRQAPSVVFLDDVESLLGDRDAADSGTERRLLVSFLMELDGLNDKHDDRYVLTIAATNKPWDLDDAILSRFERRIYIPLPDAAARRQILELLITRQGFPLAVSCDEIATRTEGFSGRELSALSKLLIEHMLRSENPDLHDIALRGREEIARYRVRMRPITTDDLNLALGKVHPGTSAEDIQRFENWNG